MNRAAKATATLIFGATAITAVSGNASAGVPYNNTLTYSHPVAETGLVQPVWWHRGYGYGYGYRRWGWGPGWGGRGRWCYWHPYAC
jgi:hypothetical protein